MSGSNLYIRGDVQILLAKVGYELRRVKKAVEARTLDRPPTDTEEHLLAHAEEALEALRLTQDHAERLGFYLEELLEGDDEAEPI